MDQIALSRPSPAELEKMNISSWSPWECEPSEFGWEYSSRETAYVLKGKAEVTAAGGERVVIGAGDLVVFAKGLKCRWKILQRIEKVYKFD
jgi:hypothetical protein